MPASSQTPNLLLPQYANGDRPKYIPDFNDAMERIDNGYKANLDAIGVNAAGITAANVQIGVAKSDAASAQQTAENALSQLGQFVQINDISFTLSTGWTIVGSSVNTVNNVLCGSLQVSTTDDTATCTITCNYIIGARVLAVDNTNKQSISTAMTNGVVSLPSGPSLYTVFFTEPWNPAWIKR